MPKIHDLNVKFDSATVVGEFAPTVELIKSPAKHEPPNRWARLGKILSAELGKALAREVVGRIIDLVLNSGLFFQRKPP